MSIVAAKMQTRRPAGSPAATGGQFAETTRTESDLDLATTPAPAPPAAQAAPAASDRRQAAAGRFAPSVLDPTKVTHIESLDLTPVEELDGNVHTPTANWDLYEDWAEEATARGRGRCTMCGQHLNYVNVMHHVDHGTFTLGVDCAESVGIAGDLGRKVSDLRANRTARTENLKRKAQFQQLCVDDPDFAAALEFADPDSDDFDPFIADVTDTVRRTGRISDSQRDAVLQGAARRREWRAERAEQAAMPKIPVPEGKQQVTGKVLSIKEEPNRFAYNSSTIKMLVLDDRGFKIWTTAPAALLGGDGGLRGKRVAFTAGLHRSDDDEFFGFGKRPTKAAFLPGGEVGEPSGTPFTDAGTGSRDMSTK